jgi:hypothetical protein
VLRRPAAAAAARFGSVCSPAELPTEQVLISNTGIPCPRFRRLWPWPTILRPDGGLAASPPMRYTLGEARRSLSLPSVFSGESLVRTAARTCPTEAMAARAIPCPPRPARPAPRSAARSRGRAHGPGRRCPRTARPRPGRQRGDRDDDPRRDVDEQCGHPWFGAGELARGVDVVGLDGPEVAGRRAGTRRTTARARKRSYGGFSALAEVIAPWAARGLTVSGWIWRGHGRCGGGGVLTRVW